MRLIFIIFLFLSCSTTQPNYSSLDDTKTALKPCPSSPNCVSSTTSKKKKKMTALSIKTDIPRAVHQLDSIIQSLPQVELISKSEVYLHYSFKTKIGGFTDDVEFLIDRSSNLIHFRSASRVGWSDAGANKRRMKRISKTWLAIHQ